MGIGGGEKVRKKCVGKVCKKSRLSFELRSIRTEHERRLYGRIRYMVIQTWVNISRCQHLPGPKSTPVSDPKSNRDVSDRFLIPYWVGTRSEAVRAPWRVSLSSNEVRSACSAK